jgi:type I restriction enzyme, S subunit
MERIDVIEPENGALEQFNIFASDIDEKIKKLTIQNRLLIESRDILLPRLMSGKINVEEAEEQLAMAAEPGVNKS